MVFPSFPTAELRLSTAVARFAEKVAKIAPERRAFPANPQYPCISQGNLYLGCVHLTNTTIMSTTPNTPSEDPAPRGYFNQGQLEDLDLADSVFAAAESYPDEMTSRDITPT
jgi:hypothetical protein